MENPNIGKTAIVPIKEMGTVIKGINVALQF
jgi:hypothetical protein